MVRALVEGGGRESPGVRGTFLCFAKETYPKERRPCCLRPLRFAAGQPGVLVRGVRRGTHFAALQLRSDNHGESVDEAGVSCGTPATPRPARPRRIQKGLSTKTSSRAIAALGPISRAQAPRAAQSRPSAAMAREDVRLRVPFTMRRGAQRPADQGSRLSERNAVERVRARPRWTRAPQVARSEAQGRSV